MALAKQVAKLEDVAEANRGLYVADGDKFKLDIEGDEDTSALRVELATAKREAAERRMAIKAIEEKYAGIDPIKTREMLAKLDQDGEQALIAAGKIDEVIQKRSEKLRADMQKQIDEAHGKTKLAEERVGKYSQRVLDDRIRDAVIGKVHVHAIKSGDVLRAAREIFTLDDSGNAVQLDDEGKPVLGKDGKTNYNPAEWIESMTEIAPHWFPSDSTGGGAGGSKNGATGGKTMKRTAFEALPARDRAAAVKQYKIVD